MDFLLQPTFLLFTFPIWLQGSDPPQTIKHKNNETAMLGANVTIFCNLTTPAEVVQITWQKIQDSSPQNIGTYSRKFGEKVLPPYQNRLRCKTIEPNCSFITIKEVKFEDEACYKCLFNVFPRGSHGGKTCLNIITLSVLRTELQTNHDTEDVVRFIYSAVGKPVPQISVFPSKVLTSSPEESLAENPNGTVTITKTFNISLEHVKVLNIQQLIVHVDHPLRKEEKVVLLPVGSECASVQKELLIMAFGVTFFVLGILIAIGTFCCWKKKKSEKPPPEAKLPEGLNAKDPEQPEEALLNCSLPANTLTGEVSIKNLGIAFLQVPHPKTRRKPPTPKAEVRAKALKVKKAVLKGVHIHKNREENPHIYPHSKDPKFRG
ncbi:nectin-1-like [Sorex araneus]|uniref:nectin-1-like n=1 Tax=Sorex araneus TaxID=42254 RepID=UPI002433BB8B|nr:nectin-1-like [Sorex araneus]